jgi:hypothetical protein
MRGGRKWAKPACGRPLDGRVRARHFRRHGILGSHTAQRRLARAIAGASKGPRSRCCGTPQGQCEGAATCAGASGLGCSATRWIRQDSFEGPCELPVRRDRSTRLRLLNCRIVPRRCWTSDSQSQSICLSLPLTAPTDAPPYRGCRCGSRWAMIVLLAARNVGRRQSFSVRRGPANDHRLCR